MGGIKVLVDIVAVKVPDIAGTRVLVDIVVVKVPVIARTKVLDIIRTPTMETKLQVDIKDQADTTIEEEVIVSLILKRLFYKNLIY